MMHKNAVQKCRTKTKTEAEASVLGQTEKIALYTENDDPQPQVLEAFGFLITNCAPSSPSL
jgi:hypothetical protein